MRIACGGLCLLIAFSALLPAVARGAQKRGKEPEIDQEEQVYDLTDDMTPPRLTRQVNPEYSPGSRGVRLQGSVVIGLVVSSRGAPKDVRVVRGLDKDVDADVVAAVRQWVFAPARKERRPVAVRITVEIAFHPM